MGPKSKLQSNSNRRINSDIDVNRMRVAAARAVAPAVRTLEKDMQLIGGGVIVYFFYRDELALAVRDCCTVVAAFRDRLSTDVSFLFSDGRGGNRGGGRWPALFLR